MRITLLNKTAGGISGGYRKYLEAMLPRLAKDPQVIALQCIVPRSWDARSWVSVNAVSDLLEYSASRFVRIPAVVLDEITHFGPDVVFVPVERTFRYRGAPVVNMLQNFEPFAEGARQTSIWQKAVTIARRHDARRMFTRTVRLIVPSAFVRTYLVEHEHVAAARVSVVHYGSDDLSADRDGSRPPQMLAQHRIRPGFLLTAGAVRPARGLEDALHALAAIRDRYGRIDTLVIAGDSPPDMRGYATALRRLCQQLGITRQVVWVGHLPRRELYWCFQNCAAFLMTTRAETFSNIAVEALANGCMIVATDSSCLPEILSGAAQYYAPGDIRQLARVAVAAAGLHGEARAQRVRASRCRAAQFSWDTTATKTLAVLSDAIRETIASAA